MVNNSQGLLSTQVHSYSSLKIKHSAFILGFIVLMFVGDAANAILLKIDSPFWRVSIFIRTLALTYFIFLLSKIPQGRKLFNVVLFIFITFIIGALSSYAKNNHYNWFENINILMKMIFFFICWQTFYSFFRSKSERSWLLRIFEYIILIQALTILIGYIFDIDLFYSYGSFKRFGYKGLIPARNELSGFLLISFFYFANKVITCEKGVIPLFLVFISGLLTGAKVALSLPFILLVLIGYWLLTRARKKAFIYVLILSLSLLTLIIWKKGYILELISPTLNYFRQQLAYGHNPHILSIFFSGRDLLVLRVLDNFRANLSIISILFGGHELSIISTETDFIDVFLFLGLTGVVTFYTFYIKTLLCCEGKKTFVQILFVTTWLITSTLAGHLVFSAINGTYLAILLLSFSWLKSTNSRVQAPRPITNSILQISS